jgi:hypothetical protein
MTTGICRHLPAFAADDAAFSGTNIFQQAANFLLETTHTAGAN